jgi:methanogenic corrinoid protein MtbC1
MPDLSDLSDQPKFTIKKVTAQTGIPAVTIRAWERRYNFLNPHRTESNYRLYSDREVAILIWLKNRIDSGFSISSAIVELKTSPQTIQISELLPFTLSHPNKKTNKSPAEYSKRLYYLLIHHDEESASNVLREASSIFDVAALCTDIITPCLVEIGEAWYRGEILISTEHFASNIIRGWLMMLYQTTTVRQKKPYILIGCAPLEFHDIGSLMLALLLRNEGYQTEYLGPDIPIDDLVFYAGDQHPALICLSATTKGSALGLKSIQEKLSRIRPPSSFGFGGRAFNLNPELRDQIPGVFLGETYPIAIKNIQSLLKST